MDEMTHRNGPDDLQPVPPTFGQRVTAMLARCMVRLLGSSLRIHLHASEQIEQARALSPSGRVAYAFWHGHQFPLVNHWRRKKNAVLTSFSRDGSLQTLILDGFGFHCIRGSASRGAVRGLIGIIRAMKKGHDAVFAVDGPQGPYHEVKPGVLYVGMKTGAAIVPLGIAVRKARIFEKAWDRYILPWPFTKVVLLHGKGITIPSGTDSGTLDRLAKELGEILEALTLEAESLL